MKRYSSEHVALCVKNFKGSALADAWLLFGPEVRSAIVDSIIMGEIRIADSIDSTVAPTAGELMAFRDAVVAALAEGIKLRGGGVARWIIR